MFICVYMLGLSAYLHIVCFINKVFRDFGSPVLMFQGCVESCWIWSPGTWAPVLGNVHSLDLLVVLVRPKKKIIRLGNGHTVSPNTIICVSDLKLLTVHALYRLFRFQNICIGFYGIDVVLVGIRWKQQQQPQHEKFAIQILSYLHHDNVYLMRSGWF